MRLVYLADARIPSRSTNSIQIMQMCSAFQQAGAETLLLYPNFPALIPEVFSGDIWAFYGISTRFKVQPMLLSSADAASRSEMSRRALKVALFLKFVLAILRQSNEPVVFYGRSAVGLWLVDRLRRIPGMRGRSIGAVIELHDMPTGRVLRKLVERLDGIVTITSALADQIKHQFNIEAGKVWIEPDGVSKERLSAQEGPTRQELCERLGLDPERPIAVYTGRVNRQKGADLLLKVAALLEPTGCQLVLVGYVYDETYTSQVAAQGWTHIRFTGFVPPAEVPAFLAAADILLLPTTSELAYADYTSPLKLFEYMAAARPIVASDLPALREILRNGENAILAAEEQPQSWADAIVQLVQDRELGVALARQARCDVEQYTWEHRAARIARRISGVLNSNG